VRIIKFVSREISGGQIALYPIYENGREGALACKCTPEVAHMFMSAPSLMRMAEQATGSPDPIMRSLARTSLALAKRAPDVLPANSRSDAFMSIIRGLRDG